MTQWNAKIEETLKNEIDQLQKDTKIDKKEDFLKAMSKALREKSTEEQIPQIEEYRHITQYAKQSIMRSYEEITLQISAALGQLAQRERIIEQEKEEINKESTKKLEKENNALKKELETANQKIDKLQKIADSTNMTEKLEQILKKIEKI